MGRLPSSPGIPVNSLLLRYNVSRLERLPSSAGIGPASSLKPRNNVSRLGRLPSSPGIPVNSLLLRYKDSRLERLPNSPGIVPVSRLLLRSRDFRLERLPRSAGIGPASSLKMRLSLTTPPLSSTSTPCHSPRGLSLSQLSLFAQLSPLVAL